MDWLRPSWRLDMVSSRNEGPSCPLPASRRPSGDTSWARLIRQPCTSSAGRTGHWTRGAGQAAWPCPRLSQRQDNGGGGEGVAARGEDSRRGRTRSAAPRLSLPPHAPETRGLAEKAGLTLLLQWGGGGPSAGHQGPGRACTPGKPCASGSSEAERQPRPIPGEETTANITACSRSLPAAEAAFSQKRTQTCHT